MQLNKLLTVIVPTKKHFGILNYWLDCALAYRCFRNIDFLILNSDDFDKTKSLKDKYKPYENIKFFDFPETFMMEDKISSIAQYKILSDYCYLCGDGILPNLEYIYNLLLIHNFSLFVMVKQNSIFFNEYKKCKNKNDLRVRLFYFLTFCGGSIVKTKLFNFEHNLNFKSNFLYPITILNNLEDMNDIYWDVGNQFEFSYLKKKSTWMNREETVQIWTINYIKSIFSLNDRYDDIKPLLITSKFDKKFSFKNLIFYKINDCFDINVFKKYYYYYKLEKNSILLLYIVKFIPLKLLQFLFNICQTIRRLKNEKKNTNN